MRTITILGSTGSIGRQALEVVAALTEQLAVYALVAHSNDQLLEEQIHQFSPVMAVLADAAAAERLRKRYAGKTTILTGNEAITAAVTAAEVDTVLTAFVGFAGVEPTLAAIRAGKQIALANKETMVAAGAVVTAAAKQHGVKILPVDSEHSALLQSMAGEQRDNIERLVLTASGGPFRGWSSEQLRQVSVAECLKHPNWSMGRKITVDSATLMNKGLEVIEAFWLFSLPYDQIDVIVHPQSIIHSMVEYRDGAVIAQLGMPDMRLPIQYALLQQARPASPWPRLNLASCQSLTFEEPDYTTFRALQLAYDAGRQGSTWPCVLNAANEIAVDGFLTGRVSFLGIVDLVERVLQAHVPETEVSLDCIVAADAWARKTAAGFIVK